MAQRITTFPVTEGSARRRYPWDEWLDGSVWKLQAGVDFDTDVDQFRNRCYTMAARKELHVRTTKVTEGEADFLVLQFFGHDDGRL